MSFIAVAEERPRCLRRQGLGALSTDSPVDGVDELTGLTHTTLMSDAIEHLMEGFAEGLDELPHELVINLSPEEARALGRRGAHYGLEALIWAARIGDTLNTTEVSNRLDITRQALAKRLAAGTILGIPGRTTTYYPVWQFQPVHGEVRPEIREIFKIFVDELGSLDAHTVSSWMMTPSKDLSGLSPHEWLMKSDDPLPAYDAARRIASRLAS